MSRKIKMIPVGTVVKVSHVLELFDRHQMKYAHPGVLVSEKTYDRNLVRRELLGFHSKYAWIVGEVQKSSGNIHGDNTEGTSFYPIETVIAYRIRFNHRGKEFSALPADVELAPGFDPEREQVKTQWPERYRNEMREIANGCRCKVCGRFTAISGILCKDCKKKVKK